jgi:ATP-dependent DNA helicase RecG
VPGISSGLDPLVPYPFRYHDQRKQAAIAELREGEEAWVVAEVRRSRVVRAGRGRARVELDVGDATGAIRVTFFNQPWRAKQLQEGTRALFFGKVSAFRGYQQLTNPRVDLAGAHARSIVPVYPGSEKAGVAGWEFVDWIGEALSRSGAMEDPVPERWIRELGLVGRTNSFRQVHGPSSIGESLEARRRLAFDELLRLQLAVVLRRKALERSSLGIRHRIDPEEGVPDLVGRFLRGLPFSPTGAQRSAIDAIAADMSGPLPMHRRLQGGVGAGKTVVALAGLLYAAQGGHQGAFMAPTEVLAEQHYLSMRDLLGDMTVEDASTLEGERPLRVALLTGRTRASSRSKMLEALREGGVDMVVGTHALLADDVKFADLGLAVVDEQHRFGVDQRARLRSKGREGSGRDPDLLVMTATPIPRSAAMVVFGDLDLTLLDELPPGRAPVQTAWARSQPEEAAAWTRVRDEVAQGRRAYVVCPLIEGSERTKARSATDELERLSVGPLEGLQLGLLHGQLDPGEKEARMKAFRTGETQVLVSTTVIEVGVDVPEATVMVVLDADRFGIAQLHQLRGRVGRSDLPSWCYLFSSISGDMSHAPASLFDVGDDAARRLQALESTTDGFELAETDLELRGEGSILGARQKGRSDLRLATLRRGARELVEKARMVAEDVLADDPALRLHPELADELDLFLDEDEKHYLSEG